MNGMAFENAMEAARQFMADTAAYRAYLNREMYLHDQVSNRTAARKEGEEHLGKLISKLLAAKRYEDAALASSDEKKRDALYMEFGL